MFADSTCPDSSCKYRNRLGYCTSTVCVTVSEPVAIREQTKAPAIDAVPIKDISEWLAGYTAPPKYALEMFPESGQCLANTRAAAWEHHIRTMIECGLIGKVNEKKEE